MNDAQLIERLAYTDAYVADMPLPEEIWTSDVALHEIERRTAMQTDERKIQQVGGRPQGPRPSRRRWLGPALAAGLAVVVAVVVAVALLGGEDESVPDVANTTTPAIVPESAGLSPLEVVEALDAAIVAGDWEAARALYSDDATYTQLDDGFGFDFVRHGKNATGNELEDAQLSWQSSGREPYSTIHEPFDWDGDGKHSNFDDMASVLMGDYAAGVNRYYVCSQTNDTTAVCDVVLEGHAFIEQAPPVVDTFVLANGLIASQTYDTTASRFEDPFGARLDYLGYLEDNYAEQVDELFEPDRLGQLTMTPDTVERHRQLIAEWAAQR